MDMVAVGSRISVRGVTGAGKTTLARRIGELLDLPTIELDAVHWLLDWQERDAEDFRERVAAALDGCPEGWVCDGNYTSKLGDLVMSRADTLVWLNLPWPLTFARLLKRTLARVWSRELLWGTNRESWRLQLFDRNSLLLYSMRSYRASTRRAREEMRAFAASKQVIELRSRREVRRFLEQVAAGR